MSDSSADEAPEVVTEEDVAVLNNSALRDSAIWGHRAGTAAVFAGLFGVAAWLWLTIRYQLDLGGRFAGFSGGDGESADLADHIDALFQTASMLLFGVVTVAVGASVRLYCDRALAAAGGTITGWEAGDVVDLPDDDLATPSE